MQPGVLRSLEFDRIREALAREAATALGRARALELEPATTPDEVRQRLSLAMEGAAFAKSSGSLALDGPEDLGDVLDHLGIAEQPLAPLELLGLARFVSSAGAVVGRIRAAESPLLGALVATVRSFDEETAAIRRAIQPSGDVDDNASAALRDIRDALRRQRSKLRSTLDGLVRGRETAKYLQDQIVSDRNGRYVIVVRSEHRDAIPGIVHGASTSGASLYVEPMATVSLNNEIVALAEHEKAEIHRILLALTDAFRARPEDLDALIAAAADLDELCAKTRLAGRIDGVAPEITAAGHLEFRGARHPLLIPAVRDLLGNDADDGNDATEGRSKGPAQVVPSDLLISPPTRALVISGPNTGGKTVALKAFGLLALMAQSGILIPVDPGSKLTPFRTVFADIGDEQSISASLSTFSAHIANLVGFERELDLPALVLLDEVGSGTDPVEGGALGAAVIDHFRKRGAIVVATTHDDALKSYGATTEGVAVAAFGFNAETFAPTYALMYGAPGRSLALEVARRLGMPAAVIADAERRRSGRESLLAAHLARVDQELAAVEQDRRRLRDDRAGLDSEKRGLLERETRLVEREAVIRKRLDDKLNERLRDARAEVDAVVTRLKTKADALAEQAGKRAGAQAQVLSTGEVGQLRAEARAALGTIESSALDGAASAAPPLAALEESPEIGDRVWVTTFGAEGIVRAAGGRQVEVEVRGKRMRVPLSALRKPGKSNQSAAGQAPPPKSMRVSAAAGTSSSLTGATRDIILIGSTVDDAVNRLEKTLDDAIVADERRLRIVHGHGTGRLRDALRSFLRGHALVASVSPAADNEGGDGATIVELKD
ncbi:MAG TPA: Smr/MutS family protein [Vicinamibacterales bacterium]|nr:Smr/MutS family protein [Vicinamibacterales bacterium]